METAEQAKAALAVVERVARHYGVRLNLSATWWCSADGARWRLAETGWNYARWSRLSTSGAECTLTAMPHAR